MEVSVVRNVALTAANHPLHLRKKLDITKPSMTVVEESISIVNGVESLK